MFIEAIIIGFIIGAIRNGRLNNFMEMRFERGLLIIIAFIFYLIPYLIKLLDIQMESPQIFIFISGVLGLLVVLSNFSKPGMKFIFVGGLFNLIIMGLNHFMMPVDVIHIQNTGMNALAESILDGTVINYIDINQSHFLSAYLGKVIILPEWYPFNQLISLGDIIMSVGIALLVQGEMLMFSSKKSGRMLSFTYDPNRKKRF